MSTRTLPPEQADELRALVRSADLPDRAARPPAPPGGADRFQYDITVRDTEGEHHVRFHDSDEDESLRALARWLEDHARR